MKHYLVGGGLGLCTGLPGAGLPGAGLGGRACFVLGVEAIVEMVGVSIEFSSSSNRASVPVEVMSKFGEMMNEDCIVK